MISNEVISAVVHSIVPFLRREEMLGYAADLSFYYYEGKVCDYSKHFMLHREGWGYTIRDGKGNVSALLQREELAKKLHDHVERASQERITCIEYAATVIFDTAYKLVELIGKYAAQKQQAETLFKVIEHDVRNNRRVVLDVTDISPSATFMEDAFSPFTRTLSPDNFLKLVVLRNDRGWMNHQLRTVYKSCYTNHLVQER